jgi:hypothetical protein
MAKRLAIPSEHVELRLVGYYDSAFISRVQKLNMNNDVPVNDVFELGNHLVAGQSVDTPSVTLTFSVFDTSIKTFAVLTGTNPIAYPAIGVDISSLSEADAVIYIKDPDINDYVKSAHAKRLQVRDFSFSYSVDGESTEDYTLIGSEKRWFKNDVIVDRFTVGTTSFTLTQTPVALKNGNNAISVILDGEYLTEVLVAPATGQYRLVGTTLTTGDSMSAKVIVVYQANPAGTNWTDISDTVPPAAIKGRDVDIFIAANSIPRIQSITINGNLNVQPVKELGTRPLVGYQSQVPSVEGTITVLDTDTELMDLLLNGSINSGDTEFLVGDNCPPSGISLEIELVDPCDGSAPYTILKTVYIPEILVTGDSWASTINQNATQTFPFKSVDGQCLVYSGSR